MQIQGEVRRLNEQIRGLWIQTRHDPAAESADVNTAPLPYPYTVPCMRGRFVWFFYWDTYWTNWGLLEHGLMEWARCNVENIAFCMSRYGYMPNHIPRGINRSQPPYFAMMVREIYERSGHRPWLQWLEPWVRREYDFWTTQRGTPTGLSRYYHCANHKELMQFADVMVKRGVVPPTASDAERLYGGTHGLAEAESGHDFTPRFNGRCADFNPVDLNSNLYAYENFLATIAGVVGQRDGALWAERAAQRRQLIQELCWDEQRGLFLDYDYVRQRRSGVASLATFWPLWVGAATQEQAARVAANLSLFEWQHGLAACEETNESARFQWAYPVVWPPLIGITMLGLDRYGYRDAARRVAQKYLQTVVTNYLETGQLWEKYDAVSGRPHRAEYEPQPMLGWTAGVFVRCARYCGFI